MFLLKILRPKDIPTRKTNWNWRVRLFHWILVKRLTAYSRGAISDTMNIGETQIIHNVRDYWYEQELQRFRIDIAQHVESSSTPYNIKRRYHRSCLFNWSETLLVFHGGKSYNIKRDKNFSIATDIAGGLKVSTDKDFILRSEFTAKFAGTNKTRNNLAETVPNQQLITPPVRENMPKQKISIHDSVPIAKPSTEPKTTKYQGFEENDQF